MKGAKSLRRSSFLAAALAISVLAGACATTPPGAAGTTDGIGSGANPNASRGSATGADENIRRDAAANDPSVTGGREVPNPRGEATRGSSYCAVRFSNHSTLIIQTYVDGEYSGAMGRYGDVYTYAIPGPTRLYARATFTDGSVDTWGPIMVDCPAGGSYTWRLTHTRY